MDIMEKSSQPMVPMLCTSLVKTSGLVLPSSVLAGFSLTTSRLTAVFTQVYERVLRGGFMFVTSKQTQKRVHHIRQYRLLTQAVRCAYYSFVTHLSCGTDVLPVHF